MTSDERIDNNDGSGLNPMRGRIISGNTMSHAENVAANVGEAQRKLVVARMILLGAEIGLVKIVLHFSDIAGSWTDYVPITERSIAQAQALVDAS